MKTFSLITLALMTISFVSAETYRGPEIYLVDHDETFDSIAQELLVKNKVKYGTRIEDFKRDLIMWNPQIKDWNRLAPETQLYVEYPYPAYVPFSYAPPLNIGDESISEKRFTLSMAYTASTGQFEEELTTQSGNITSTQNSPISIGLSATRRITDDGLSAAASLYWSSLTTSNLTGASVTSAEIETKPEIGANIYLQQLSPWMNLSFYGGLDYEMFSTFNTISFAAGEALALNQNKLIFGTIGVSHTSMWTEKMLTLKLALSQSLNSQTNSVREDDIYKGQRLLIFSHFKFKKSDRFSYHFLFKRHMLEGTSKLTINRAGIGLGFSFY